MKWVPARWILSAVLAAVSAPAIAADTYWQHDPATPGDWFDPANWTNGLPGTGHINNGGMAEFDGGHAGAHVLYLGSLDGTSGALDIRTDASYHCTSAMIGHGVGSGGVVTVDRSTWTAINWTAVGVGGTGELTLRNGSSGSTRTTFIGWNEGSSGVLTIDGPGSSWQSEEEPLVGMSGSGTFNILNGAHALNGECYLGRYTGSDGAATVDGADSTWTNTERLRIGYEGRGALQVRNGGRVSSTAGLLAVQELSESAVTVDGPGSEWEMVGSLTVGNGGQGSAQISNGGAIICHGSNSSVAHDRGSQGSVTVDGVGSMWTTDSLTIGRDGTATLEILRGGSVSSTTCRIASCTGSQGSVLVDGAGSAWNVDQWLWVGYYNTASLSIRDGGLVSCTSGRIKGRRGGTNTVTVQGAGSRWSTQELVITNGTLEILDGGSVSSARCVTAQDPDSHATVVVDGPGSTWTTGNLGVGGEGTAAVRIRNGASVSSAAVGLNSPRGHAATVTVEGSDSTWTCDGYLRVAGCGTFRISDGASVSSTSGHVYAYTYGGGAATVEGAGSSWSIATDLEIGGDEVGQNGPSSLTVRQGASVTVGNELKVWPPASVLLEDGTITAGTVVLEGVLEGQGSTQGDLTNAGELSPGSSPGTLVIEGHYTQTADGLLRVEVGGTGGGQFDVVTVAGGATLGGALEVSMLEGFVPSAGDRFPFMTVDSLSGQFAGVSGWCLGGGLYLELAYATESLTLVARQAVPGDANCDGSVDGGDYTVWADHYIMSGLSWCQGDFNGDRCVDGADFTLWADNYGSTGLAAGGCVTAAAAVPEPCSTGLLLLAFCGLMRKRRR